MNIEWVEIDEDGVVHLYHPETGEYVGPKSQWLAPEVTSEDEALAVMRAIANVKANCIADFIHFRFKGGAEKCRICTCGDA